MPRVAALLDVAQISEITSVESADTFKRPIYAGNVIATVQSAMPKKLSPCVPLPLTPRAAEGGSATVEAVDAVHDAGISAFVGKRLQYRTALN